VDNPRASSGKFSVNFYLTTPDLHPNSKLSGLDLSPPSKKRRGVDKKKMKRFY
jgi:hypothetical protein